MANIKGQYNRALQIAYFILEGGHLVSDVCQEFRISHDTFQRDMKLLATYGYDEELKRNRVLYIKVKTALHTEDLKRRKMKRG